MKRSILLVLVAALALAIGANATAAASAGASGDAQAAAKKKAKKKAAKCKAKKKAKGKGKAKGRRSLAAASAKGKAKAKGRKGKRRGCGKAKRKATPRPRGIERRRMRSPHAEKLLERFRERQERRESRPPAPTIKDMVPEDGTYTAAAAPGLTVTISAGGTQARVAYTVPKTAFSTQCQAHTEGVLVDLSGELSPSQSTQRGYVMFDDSRPMPDSRRWSVNGSIGKDGSFQLSVSASFPYPPDPNASCSGYAQLTGQLVRQ